MPPGKIIYHGRCTSTVCTRTEYVVQQYGYSYVVPYVPQKHTYQKQYTNLPQNIRIGRELIINIIVSYILGQSVRYTAEGSVPRVSKHRCYEYFQAAVRVLVVGCGNSNVSQLKHTSYTAVQTEYWLYS